jgi:TRAP-type C4-dicarboxylate transport system permease small subunit
MARLCPQCGEIHFETSTNPLPSACRKCGANLNEASGLMPGLKMDEEQATTPPPKTPPKVVWGQLMKANGFKGIIVGVLVIAAAGVMLYLGWTWHTRVKEAKATVHAGNDAPKWAKRDRATATYVVGSKTYHQYPGVRPEGATFTVYYLPEDPATGYEMKPILWLIIGGMVLLIGLAILTFAVFKFTIGRAQTADFRKVMAQTG